MSSDLLPSTVAEIERLVVRGMPIETIDGVPVSRVPLTDARQPDPEPARLSLSTLSSLSEYVNGTIDDEYRRSRGLFVHVAAPDRVSLFTSIFGVKRQRVAIVDAKAINPNFPFGSWQDPESFNVSILTHFEDTTDRASLLKLTGNLTTEAVQTVADDGVTQQVTARQGIARRTDVEVKAVLTLKPYRTFGEVAQPESPFVLRLRGGGNGSLPTCALFEADGGRWRAAAIENVKALLVARLPASIPVYG